MATTAPSRTRLLARVFALFACCVVSACLFLLGLLVTWSTIKLVAGLTPYPPGTELHWRTPAIGLLFAISCFASSAAFSYVGISNWWPDLMRRAVGSKNH